jgi:transcriptional regulator with XRE-family HTH domain
MAVNTALRTARVRAHMSQMDLARRIQEVGFMTGDPNGCSREMVQRWESGRTIRPQPRYLLALENVFGQPAASLGFADVDLGVDRGQAVADAGLDRALPLPDPAAQYGELTGVWLSAYDYYSSSRDQTFSGKHHVMLLQRGARLMVRSLPASSSRMSMDLSVNGQVVTGTWTEETRTDGYYRGALYYGAIQMLVEPTGRRIAGKWVGFGRDMTVNTEAWRLTLVDSEVDEAAVERWNREPE